MLQQAKPPSPWAEIRQAAPPNALDRGVKIISNFSLYFLYQQLTNSVRASMYVRGGAFAPAHRSPTPLGTPMSHRHSRSPALYPRDGGTPAYPGVSPATRDAMNLEGYSEQEADENAVPVG